MGGWQRRPNGVAESCAGVRAETLEGTDLAAAWERLEREAPEYPKYRTKTDREIAIVRLRSRSNGSTDESPDDDPSIGI
jgi:hypothetical protein